MKLILNFIHFIICLPIAGLLLIAIEVYYFKGFRRKKKPVYQPPTLKISRTVVSKEFLGDFKSWDDHLASSNLIIL